MDDDEFGVFRRKYPRPNLKSYVGICLEGYRKPQKAQSK
jgi:hypothetical protein